MKTMVLDGNAAAAEAIILAKIPIVAAYPITPQSPLVEKLAVMQEKEAYCGKCVCVESEHSAAAYAIGVQLTGIRCATATSSVGLALMHEVLGVASGCRVPIVMPIVNRALVSPWSLWCDHQDTMAERDSGWIQFYAENAQEVFDLIIAGYRIAEHEDVLLPMMVCMDGFFVSHAVQKVETIPPAEVEAFIGPYCAKNLFLDTGAPMFINTLTSPEEFTEMRYQQETAFHSAEKVADQIFLEFGEKFGRHYELVSSYRCDDADAILIGLGSMCGTIKQVVKDMRGEGYKVGMIKITSFRPFPRESLMRVIPLKGCPIGVIDRSAGLGTDHGPMFAEVEHALRSTNHQTFSIIAGLGGRDIGEKIIKEAFLMLLDGNIPHRKTWIDVKDAPDQIRPWRYKL